MNKHQTVIKENDFVIVHFFAPDMHHVTYIQLTGNEQAIKEIYTRLYEKVTCARGIEPLTHWCKFEYILPESEVNKLMTMSKIFRDYSVRLSNSYKLFGKITIPDGIYDYDHKSLMNSLIKNNKFTFCEYCIGEYVSNQIRCYEECFNNDPYDDSDNYSDNDSDNDSDDYSDNGSDDYSDNGSNHEKNITIRVNQNNNESIIKPLDFSAFIKFINNPPDPHLIPCVVGELNWESFDNPFSYLNDILPSIYSDTNWTINLCGLREEYASLKELITIDFLKKHMHTILFFQEGANAEENWILIGQLDNGLYYCFDAGCDYTGFDVQGGGLLSTSYNWIVFWNMSLDTLKRSLLTKRILDCVV